MKLKKTLITISIIGIVILVISGLVGGCSSSILAPELSPSERAQLEDKRFDLTVGVEKYEHPVYSAELISALRGINLFNRVDYIENFEISPQLIARVEQPVSGTAVVPIFTMFSLGIIPTWTKEEHGYVFSLFSEDSSYGSVIIDCTFEGYTVLGWVCGFLNMSPNRTSLDPERHKRYYDRLSLSIVSQYDEIKKLSSKNED